MVWHNYERLGITRLQAEEYEITFLLSATVFASISHRCRIPVSMSLVCGSKERLWHPVTVRKSLSGISGNPEVITTSKNQLAFHLN
jgi:hypothetical protein